MSKCYLVFTVFVLVAISLTAQQIKNSKRISPNLFGIFFEDINYSADGGLYAELVQNRSFEYSPTEQKSWNPLSFWEYISPGFSYGRISVETTSPIHQNNPHYIVIDVEHVGHEANYIGDSGVGIKNYGYGGMVINADDKYILTFFARQISEEPINFNLSLQSTSGSVKYAESEITVSSKEWKKYSTTFIASENSDSAVLVILATSKCKFAIDVISLFPEKTFHNRENGLRNDLAQVLADMKPKFIRFPGGCLVHGDGLGNMYRWKNTIGPIEQRKEQRNIWGYNQTSGLGYFEYFQFCEDIGAKPLPVVPAGVSCQNSGGTWRIGGTGQKALPISQMPDYVQEILDLIEWANGPVTSIWGSKRAEAGHAKPFNLEYIGIGNEDKMTPEFIERFKMIYEVVKAKHPEIKVIGTVGPFHSGEDFDKGWKLADELKIPIVDEHYYTDPKWFIANQFRYDKYDRSKSKVYFGEYASWGNKFFNALAEAAYLTSLERNGDLVVMASYAPLFAKKDFTQWKIDMIFFDNSKIVLTPNYFVQKMFMNNQGDLYLNNIIEWNKNDSSLAASAVLDTQTEDIVLKLVNACGESKKMKINLSDFANINSNAELTLITGNAEDENTFENPKKIENVQSNYIVSANFEYKLPALSFSVIRIKNNK
ncbi:MAG: alpha-N-arabinofuranosidase [Ignavibacteriales bacterium]|nr:alpha-N-arabinofuranosidase [Ignavibacteriales bacterium]